MNIFIAKLILKMFKKGDTKGIKSAAKFFDVSPNYLLNKAQAVSSLPRKAVHAAQNRSARESFYGK